MTGECVFCEGGGGGAGALRGFSVPLEIPLVVILREGGLVSFVSTASTYSELPVGVVLMSCDCRVTISAASSFMRSGCVRRDCVGGGGGGALRLL